MSPGSFRFERFLLDPDDRRLSRDDALVELNTRYLDALILLVREQGKLVSKDRFLEEVWQGVPVTDEALTQCIKTLRRQLGDNAANPSFIETIPKHGYRFVAPVQSAGHQAEHRGSVPAVPARNRPPARNLQKLLLLGGAGTIGGGVAGTLGGLFYGFAATAQPLQAGMGAASVLLVLTCVTLSVALAGAAGVSFGIAAADRAFGRASQWSIVGGACGGLVVGGLVKLLGIDAFNLLFGQSPGDITGAAEGAMLGGAVGLGHWLGNRGTVAVSLGRGVAAAAFAGGAAGILIALLGGRLMGGSLDLLARSFPHSRLRFDQIGSLLGETGFGPVSTVVTGGLEGGLFGACIVGAMMVARKSLSGNS